LLSGSLAERARRGEARLEEATEEIADLQAFNQYVFDNLLSGLATADANNRLLTFNRSGMLITGRDGALPIGESAAESLQLPPAFAANLSQDLARVRSKRYDYQFRMPKGNVIELGLSVAALPLPDGSRGYLYTFQDVTDVKRFEQNARLQQRLAAVGEWPPASRTKFATRSPRCPVRCRCSSRSCRFRPIRRSCWTSS
jgi:PAS domain S-box-containing protein